MRQGLKQLAASIFGLRRGERGLALWMFLYHYLLLLSLYLLKPVRDSFFLTEAGAQELPYVFILTTVVVIPMALLYARASRRVRLGWLVNGTTVILIAGLVGLYALLPLRSDWVYYTFYVWVSIYGVLVTSQFWLFANAVFDAAQAKRTFALLSLGAILGAVTGGEATGLLIENDLLDSSLLLLLAGGVLALTVLLVNAIRLRAEHQQPDVLHREEEKAEAPPARLSGIVETLRTSRHLLLIVGIIALAVLTTTIVDFQFKTVASQAYPTEDALSTFMGRFYSRVSVVALLFQLLLAPRLIRLLGAGGSLLLLPAGLLAGSFWMLVHPGIVAGTALRGIDQSLKHSIDKTGRELLFLPIELETKKRVKVFIDMFMDHGAQGLGGALLLLLTLVLGLDVRGVSLVLMGLLVVWAGLVLLARYSYVEAFRNSIEEQVEEEPTEPREEREQPPVRATFRKLSSRSARKVAEGLEALEQSDVRVPVSLVQRLMHHRSPEVRRRALRVVRMRNVSGLAGRVATHLEDHDDAVRLEAARYLYRELDEDRTELVRRGLRHPDARVQALAVGLVAKEGGPQEHVLLSDHMLRELGEGDQECRTQVARALGCLDRSQLDDLLHRLMDDPSPEVARRALRSAGTRGDRAFVHHLVQRLTDETHRDVAQEALALYGDRLLGTLFDYMTDPLVPLELRVEVPAVLTHVGTQAAVDVLLVALQQASVPVRHAVTVALSTLRSAENELRFSWETVRGSVREETRHYAALGQITYLLHRSDHPAGETLSTETLEHARSRSLERIFRLLGLYYLQPDMHHALLGLTSEEQNLRAGALEFVDNLLDWDTKQFLLPLLDDPTGEQAAGDGADAFDVHLDDWPAALAYLLDADDPPLVVAALRCAAAVPEVAPADAVRDALHHPDPDVREAARRARRALEQNGQDQANVD